VAATISILKWDEHQHYKKRDPTWIKVYRDTLTSVPWIMGDDGSRLMMMCLMLIAARYQNAIPANPSLISKMAYLQMSESSIAKSLEKLVELEFIKIQGLSVNGAGIASALLSTCTSEQSRAEQSRADSERKAVELEASPTDTVKVIFEHWQKTFGKSRSKMDPKRHGAIKRALKTYDQQTLIDSINGYKRSEFHAGANEKHTVYDDIELFLRDAKHIDAGLALLTEPKRQVKYS